MICAKCGAKNADGTSFCSECGSAFKPIDELVILDNKCRKVDCFRIFIIPASIITFLVVWGIYALISQKSGSELIIPFFVLASIFVFVGWFGFFTFDHMFKSLYRDFELSVLKIAGQPCWRFETQSDYFFSVKSKQATAVDPIKFFKDDRARLNNAITIKSQKRTYKTSLETLINSKDVQNLWMYGRLVQRINANLKNLNDYFIFVSYSSPSGKSRTDNLVPVSLQFIERLENDPSPLMSKSEYSRYVKEQAKIELEKKRKNFYNMVNAIIDDANNSKDNLLIKNDVNKLDDLINNDLLSKTINTIDKIKDIDSGEWDLLSRIISEVRDGVNNIISKNNRLLEYYNSEEFLKIKSTCDALMSSQREFNEYIGEKVKSISDLFGKGVARNETTIEDEYNYIRPYKKRITPFTAEVSDSVFDSAENNPLEYVVKQFYPDKAVYPEQIQKLQLLIEELETLKDAKRIIENYKQEVQQYLSDVPAFIMDNDKDGFYSKLGFATINENTLTVEYEFANTSRGGKTRRRFNVPMNEDNIVRLIQKLGSKLTMVAFTKEQRSLMTAKLRQQIKERDNFTCKNCGNSTHAEPNLLLEIDHIIPVAKGGLTLESNLQTLCWKCNRSKSAKIL